MRVVPRVTDAPVQVLEYRATGATSHPHTFRAGCERGTALHPQVISVVEPKGEASRRKEGLLQAYLPHTDVPTLHTFISSTAVPHGAHLHPVVGGVCSDATVIGTIDAMTEEAPVSPSTVVVIADKLPSFGATLDVI